jgi:hypothetical protein
VQIENSNPTIEQQPVLGEHVLYQGSVVVKFDPIVHRYRVHDILETDDFVTVPSVTTVLGAMLNKPFLQKWAAKLAAQSMIATFTPGRAYDGASIQRMAWTAADAHKAALADAGTVGSEVHEAIELYLRQRAGESVQFKFPTDARAAKCFMAATRWVEENQVKAIATERVLYSRRWKVVGTTDLAANVTVGGRTACIDWKSSSRLHRSYELQTAAYRAIWHEMGGQHLQDRWLVRLDRETGACEPLKLNAETADREADAFFKMVEAYRALSELKFFEEAA